jgi:tRNA-guanine family transglycosylase
MELSLRWAARSKRAHEGNPNALFGIVQGGVYPACASARRADALIEIGFDGYAVGGLAVGEPAEERERTLDDTVPAAARRTAALPDGSGPARGHRRGGQSSAASTCSTA